GVSARTAFRRGWIAGTVAFLAALSWVTYPITHYTRLPAGAAVFACALLASVEGAFIGGSAALWAAAKRRGVPVMVTVPLAWVALEWTRTFFPIGFPWLLLGYALHPRLALIQVADVTGV